MFKIVLPAVEWWLTKPLFQQSVSCSAAAAVGRNSWCCIIAGHQRSIFKGQAAEIGVQLHFQVQPLPNV
jgi:hypothetical protein